MWVRFLPGLPVANAAPCGVLAVKCLRRMGLTEKERTKPNAIQRYVRETSGELRKVSWPTWPEARRLTVLVLLVMVVMGAFLGLVDLAARQGLFLALGV